MPAMKQPLLSIIIPSYNQGQYIRETIESCLAQDYRPIEILVIDGASTDGTLEVLEEYRNRSEVRWISEPDRGVVEAVNKGFAMASGEFGAIQSSDDIYLPGAAARAVEVLSAEPELGFVFGDIMKITADGREVSVTSLAAFSVESVLSVRTWIPQPSCFFRMSLARELGGWRESVPYAADTDLWFRMMLRAGGLKLDRVMAKRRVHGAQRDTQGARIIRDYTQMIRDLFDSSGALEEYRLAAEAGILLQMNRYGYNDPESVKQQRREEAVRIYPPLGRTQVGNFRIPGAGRVRKALASLRKRLSCCSGGGALSR